MRTIIIAISLILVACSGSDNRTYSANGCYCREGYRLARGNGTENEAIKVCSDWPGWGAIEKAFKSFNEDLENEIYCNKYSTFTTDEIRGYLDKDWRVSINWVVVPPDQCNAPEGQNCNHFSPMYSLDDLNGKTIEYLCVAGHLSE